MHWDAWLVLLHPCTLSGKAAHCKVCHIVANLLHSARPFGTQGHHFLLWPPGKPATQCRRHSGNRTVCGANGTSQTIMST